MPPPLDLFFFAAILLPGVFLLESLVLVGGPVRMHTQAARAVPAVHQQLYSCIISTVPSVNSFTLSTQHFATSLLSSRTFQTGAQSLR